MNLGWMCLARPCVVAVLMAGPVLAQVHVVGQTGAKITLDWNAFQAGPDEASQTFLATLRQDLGRSGYFAQGAPGRSEVTLSGNCRQSGGSLRAECRVLGTMTQRAYLAKGYSSPASEARRFAHQVADAIVLAVAGKPGMASGRMVLVGTQSGKKELYLADSDGRGLVQITRDNSVSVAPKWGPGQQVVYTSYLNGYPDVYLVNVADGKRERISNFAGLNTGADLSPDGRDVALVLSKDGNPELYVKNLRSGKLTRLTRTPHGGEASPSWSPQGDRIVYVSDESGRPHLYILSRNGGRGKRVSSHGTENVAPDWGRNGLIVYCTRQDGRYQIATLDPQSGGSRIVSTRDGADYEDPSWAPDGRHVACTRTAQYRSQVYLLDTKGDPPIALTNYSGDWFSPSWSP